MVFYNVTDIKKMRQKIYNCGSGLTVSTNLWKSFIFFLQKGIWNTIQLEHWIALDKKINQDSYVIVGPVHDVVDPVVEPQYELGPGYQPQQGQCQGQQVIPAQKAKHFIAFEVLKSKA